MSLKGFLVIAFALSLFPSFLFIICASRDRTLTVAFAITYSPSSLAPTCSKTHIHLDIDVDRVPSYPKIISTSLSLLIYACAHLPIVQVTTATTTASSRHYSPGALLADVPHRSSSSRSSLRNLFIVASRTFRRRSSGESVALLVLAPPSTCAPPSTYACASASSADCGASKPALVR